MPVLREITDRYCRYLLLACSLFLLPAQAPVSREYQLKAVFLFNFTRFTEWPPGSFPKEDSPLIVGILGEKNPFGPSLEEVVSGEKANNHPLVVQHYNRAEEIKDCHVLFINITEAARLEQVIANLKGKPILTAGDSPVFLQKGGMIRFYTKNNKIQLQINLEAVKAANLILSSKLLRLAEIFVPGKKE